MARRMEKSGKRHRRLTESNGGTRYQQRIDDENLFLPRGANDAPTWVGLDLPRADRPGENEIGIAFRDIFQPDWARRSVDVGVHVPGARNINQLAHEAAGTDCYERRIPDVPEHPRLRSVPRREPHAIERVLNGIDDRSGTG